jgi:cytochrome c peroxidase
MTPGHSTVSILAALAAMALGAACSQEVGKSTSSSVTPADSSGPRAPSVPVAAAEASSEINPRLLRRFQPLPDTFESEENPHVAARVSLGRMLYYDARLSKDNDVSCSSCHDLDSYGVDHQKTSTGHKKQLGGRNAPTVYNAAGFFVQFWDGRKPTIEEQAKAPILNPVEMAMVDGPEVVAKLGAIPGYVRAFQAAFADDPKPLSYDNLGRAIGAFERGLVTPGRWDKFLKGDSQALSAAEKEGLRTFLNVGCMVCHTGAYLGGSMFERVGAVEPWPNQKDRGREEVTHVAGDGMMFKVPTLRNIQMTAPYFHDGSVATLPEAVRMMGKHQLGLELSEAETGAIVTWLDALTGEIPKAYVAKPELPAAP